MKLLGARETVSEAIQMLFTRYPLFANIAARWEIIEDKTGAITQTMATDGKRLLYNPAFVDSLGVQECCWVLYHESGHCFLGHHLRLKNIGTKESRNIAFDLALNSLIREDCPEGQLRGMMLAPGFGSYADYEMDQTSEYYHKKIQPPPEQQPQQQQQQDPDSEEEGEDQDQGDGESSEGAEGHKEQQEQKQPDKGQQEEQKPGNEQESPGESSGEQQEGTEEQKESSKPGKGQQEGSKGQQESPDSQNQPGEGGEAGKGKGKPAEGAGEGQGQGEGSGEGQPQPGSSQGQNGGGQGQPGGEDQKPSSMGEVLPAPELAESPEAAAQAEQDWQQTVAESMALAETCGSLPGWLRDLGRELLGQSETDWRMILRRYLTKLTPQGVSFTRPSRRNSWRRDVILPARRSKGATDGGIIADTSGSIFKIIRRKVLPEIDKILRVLPKTSVRLVQNDARITGDETFTRWDLPLRVEVSGGGGTNLNPAFELLREDRRSLKWIVCITDMEWSFQNAPDPGVPVLWIVVNNPGFDETRIPFGEVVKVPLDKRGI